MFVGELNVHSAELVGEKEKGLKGRKDEKTGQPCWNALGGFCFPIQPLILLSSPALHPGGWPPGSTPRGPQPSGLQLRWASGRSSKRPAEGEQRRSLGTSTRLFPLILEAAPPSPLWGLQSHCYSPRALHGLANSPLSNPPGITLIWVCPLLSPEALTNQSSRKRTEREWGRRVLSMEISLRQFPRI